MTTNYWGFWLGGNMNGAAQMTGSATCYAGIRPDGTGTAPTVTDFTPPPPPSTSPETVEKIRLVRDQMGDLHLFTGMVKLGNPELWYASTVPTTNGGTLRLGAKYKNLNNPMAFDANPLGGFINGSYNGVCAAYCASDQIVNYEVRVRATRSAYAPAIYAGRLPDPIKSTTVSVGGFGGDVLTTDAPLAQPNIYDYEEFIPDVLEVQDEAGSYQEVWDTGKRLTRVPTQYAYEKWHDNLYKHEVYHPAIYKEQSYTPAKYEKQVWNPPPPYTETYQGEYTTYIDVQNTVRYPYTYIRNQYINPYRSPCDPYPRYTTPRQYRREEVSITYYNVTYVGYKRYKLVYKQWRAYCTGSGYWSNTGQYIWTDTPPADTSTERWNLIQSGYWSDTGNEVTTDTPPAGTSTTRWVLKQSSYWVFVENIELNYIPTNSATDRWRLVTAAHWERVSTDTYSDTAPTAPSGYRYVKLADPFWRAEQAADRAEWQRWQVTEPRWVKKCSWHPAGLQERTVPPYPFWRLLGATEPVNGRPTRVMLAGRWEPWVPASTGQTVPAGTEGKDWRKTLRLSAFSVPKVTAAAKSALVLHTDQGTFMAHGAVQYLAGWQQTVSYRVSADLGHFQAACGEDANGGTSMQALAAQTWPQVYDPAIYRVRETLDNYQVEEAYKVTATNGTYYSLPGAAIDSASATAYLRAPELYPAKIDKDQSATNKQVGWYSIAFTDNAKGAVPHKGTESGGYYVIQTTWAVKFRNRVLDKTGLGPDESLDYKIFKISGTVTRGRKIRPGEDLAGKSLLTVKNAVWRYLYPGEDPAGRPTQTATILAAQNVSILPKPQLFFLDGKIKTAIRNPADNWRSDRISVTLDLGFRSAAGAPATMRGWTNTSEGRYIVIGEKDDGLYHCVVEVQPDGTFSLYKPLTRLAGAPLGKVKRVQYPYSSGGDAVGVFVDTYQPGGLRQYAAFGVRGVYTSSAGPFIPGQVALIEDTAGPADHDFAADAVFSGPTCIAVYRDRVAKTAKSTRVTVSF